MTHNPERALWQEVLLRQVDDATSGPSGVSGVKDRTNIIKDARAFLTKRSRQFENLCLFAGLEMDAVIMAMRTKIEDAPPVADLATNRKKSRAIQMKRTKETKAKQIKCVDRLITCKGVTLTMAQWANRTGLTVSQIASRIRNDWTVERALTQPMGKRNRGWGMTGAAHIAQAPGVGSNFGASQGTGGGTSAQDSPNITFSGNALGATPE